MGLLSDWVDSVQHRFSSPEAFGQGLLSALTTNIGFTPEDLAYRYRTGEFRHAPELGFGLGGITAWHGSPHKFDQFDISKVGTGEGAQAYGHGLYFADMPGTAKTYQNMRQDDPFPAMDEISKRAGIDPIMQKTLGLKNYPLQELAEELAWNKGRGQDAISSMKNVVRMLKSDGKYSEAQDYQKWIDFLSDKKVSLDGIVNEGFLYEVDIPDSAVAKMLNWDAPLSEQPDSVRAALEKAWIAHPLDDANKSGAEIYHQLMAAEYGPTSTPAGASAALNAAGIPGIKYWDGGSRAAGAGTRNYVVFDPELLTILSRNGLGLLD